MTKSDKDDQNLFTQKQIDSIYKGAIRLHQNRKDFVMRTKNELYVTL